MYQLSEVGRADSVKSPVLAADLSFDAVCGALTNVIYAYAGHWLYYELLHTMRRHASCLPPYPTCAPPSFLPRASLQCACTPRSNPINHSAACLAVRDSEFLSATAAHLL